MRAQSVIDEIPAKLEKHLPRRVWNGVRKVGFILGLLTLGYQEHDMIKKRYINRKEWLRFKRTLELKIQNVVVVSGLTLA
ncbi:hypothetical protein FRB90_005174, partial [Tulasnella sp. 427]